jgi:hypothetical protein
MWRGSTAFRTKTLFRGRAQQCAEADRREVDPPIEVETATLSKAGQLNWWVKERRE